MFLLILLYAFIIRKTSFSLCRAHPVTFILTNININIVQPDVTQNKELHVTSLYFIECWARSRARVGLSECKVLSALAVCQVVSNALVPCAHVLCRDS